MGLALSTAWNSLKFDSGNEIIQQIKALGFEEVELNFNLTSSMVNEILDLVKKSQIKITSVHNFCPIPEGIERKRILPDYYSLASLDERERQRAIHYTKVSIDTASQLNARAVVIHCGRIEYVDPTFRLIELYRLGMRGSPYYKKILTKMLKEREKHSKPFFESILRSLEILNRYAQQRNILLGIENRFCFFEIPSFEETGIILNNFRGGNIFYWHDTGHAYIHEKLGLAKHIDFLYVYSDHLCGIHLHDVVGISDHKAVLEGEIDFNIFCHYIKKETIKVMEVHAPSGQQEIIRAKSYLESIFNGRL